MTWQLGLILTCLALIALWPLSEWWAARGMRRRARKREAYARYCELVGQDVKWMGRDGR